MIDCLKCYRVHKCGDNVYYCPFFAVNPCVRGEHQVILPDRKPRQREQELKAHIPKFVPLDPKGKSSILWEAYHEIIFEMLYNGVTQKEIAQRLGIEWRTLGSYIHRYRRYE